jgi:hypothetical protein
LGVINFLCEVPQGGRGGICMSSSKLLGFFILVFCSFWRF